jgi:very-short-patch-repair endonuclease
MRYNVSRKHSTKPERIVYELLKELRIPFRHRWKIGRLEIDFLVGRYAIDIDGHEQNGERNHKIAEMGYVPIHFHNSEILNNRQEIKNKLKDL